MLDICKIANLNVLRLLNETTAVALAYGFYQQDLSSLKVVCSTWQSDSGGRDIDNYLVRYFCEEFKTKYNLNVYSNNRAVTRLLQECEKLKKQLSANPQVLPLNIECFMDDKDVSSSMGRDKLEELCGDMFAKVEVVLNKLLGNIVELVGGTTRIPAIKNIIKRIFGFEPSTTLNLDEAVARGCALQAAMLSPAVKVRDFLITDVQPYTIKLVWNISKNERGDIEAFPKRHPVPFSKLLTFFRKEDFALNAFFSLETVKY
ncbi:heat shock 70 kDa protein 4L [Caerostris extrusa]|uniref:Heat shock 70 kDa protein 4L n=1 Tax=Caerostris extrusa TaxID=172846 RepID=A0AAV4T1D4_CAEEX|nr:heat shock 70 kDa protein 4L [Caerostris extrusa]